MQTQTVGTLLRDWRQRRRLTQMDLALEADISPRHLSFVETGRASPSREMLLHLSEELEIPLRERNALLVAGGYAPLDRHWNIVATNHALPELYAEVAPELKQAPNAMRLALHPKGLAPHIENLPEWRAHLLARLRKQVEVSADPVLADLLKEALSYPGENAPKAENLEQTILVPMKIRSSLGLLSFMSTTTVFGTPVDVTLSELAIEMFFPSDSATAEAVRKGL
jgi:transcriptional regulator with XRE-family HTH domain